MVSADFPAELRARRTGRLSDVQVEDGAWVQAGDLIAHIDGDGVRTDMAMVRAWLDDLRDEVAHFEFSTTLSIPKYPEHFDLGSVGPRFQGLVSAIDDLNRSIEHDEMALQLIHLKDARAKMLDRQRNLRIQIKVKEDLVVAAQDAFEWTCRGLMPLL